MSKKLFKTLIRNEMHDVEGVEVSVHPLLETFAYKGDGLWFVVEMSTGKSIGYGMTRVKAIERAQADVERIGVERVLKLIGQSDKRGVVQDKLF